MVLPVSSPTPYDIVRPSYDITATSQLTMNNMVSSTLLVGAYCRWNKCVATKCIGHTQLDWVQTVLLVWRFKRPLSVWATSISSVSVLVRLFHLCMWCSASEWEVLAVEVSELCSELPQKCWEEWLQREKWVVSPTTKSHMTMQAARVSEKSPQHKMQDMVHITTQCWTTNFRV